jgi:hypothetical protein
MNPVQTICTRIMSGIQWIHKTWDLLELSFKHREEFISTKILAKLLVDDDLILNEGNIIAIESELSLECKKLQNLSSMQEAIDLVSKREKLKLRVEQINSQVSTAKEAEKQKLIAERSKKMTEVTQFGDKIEAQLEKWEKRFEQELLYRGLRYRDVLNFDKLKKEYEEDLESQEQYRKWASRYAKKFA